MGVRYNIFSPEGDNRPNNRRVIAINNFANRGIDILNQLPFNYPFNNARGSFTYKSKGKSQEYTLDIKTLDDALLITAMILNREILRRDDIPVQYRKTYKLFQDLPDDKNFFYKFKSILDPWLNPRTRGRKVSNKQVKNPETKRFIKLNGATYKKVFMNIKLKKVKYDLLENYKCVDYDVDEYCVISYLSNYLLKKEYKIIEDELRENPTPTSNELQKMLNKIDYNLNVYITDKECISEQNEFKKTLRIMIHNEHMYVLKNCEIEKSRCKVKKCDKKEFESIKSEIYTDSHKIKDGVKYKLNSSFDEIEKDYNMRGSFTQVNIDFYDNCGIRAPRYINQDISNVQSLDIKKCYFNILNNNRYIFPVQDGNEVTKRYIKGDKIESHGFYFVEFKKEMTDIEKSLFSKRCWILGYLIINLKLNITIEYKHVANGCSNVSNDKKQHEYLNIIFYTGFLSNYIKTKTRNIICFGDELEAYRLKYNNNKISSETRGYIKYEIEKPSIYKNKDKMIEKRKEQYDTIQEREEIQNNKNNKVKEYIDPEINITKEYFLQKSGIYAYLAIMQYVRYELYLTYMEICKESDEEVNVHKIYTDCVTYDVTLSDKQIEKIDKNLIKKYGFGVSKKETHHTWTQKEKVIKEPIVTEYTKPQIYDNIIELFDKEESFCIDARAGYGKSHTIMNTIIPMINERDKKYILTSTTIESSEKLNCKCIHSILASNESYIQKLSDTFKDIDYLIIDECSRLNDHLLKMIEFVKGINKKLIVIMVGDSNQCDSFDNNETMDCNIFKRVCCNNFFNMKWHPKARYCKKYDEFLTKVLSFKEGGKNKDCITLIRNFFKDQIKKVNEEDNNEIRLTYTHKNGKSLLENQYKTVHKSQGDTISERYSIYEIDRMPRKVLYTALSRCSDYKLIEIYLD